MSSGDKPSCFSRRKFLKLGPTAAAVAVAAGIGGYITYRSTRAASPSILTPTPKPASREIQTLRVPEDYPSVHAAIVAASPGDAIEVGLGTYPGFTVEKPVTITGLGSIIVGKVEIKSNETALNGFTLESDVGDGVIIDVGASNNKVSGNTIRTAGSTGGVEDHSHAVRILGHNNEVSGNTLKADMATEIEVGGGGRTLGNNKILGNTLEGGIRAVSISTGDGNEVLGNIINSEHEGVYIATSKDNKISNNSIKARRDGITIFGTDNEVSGNTIRNSRVGIFIPAGTKADKNIFFENNFIDNATQAKDSGSNNLWFKNSRGNYWDEWTSPDDNKDGIVDKPYAIAGTARSVDKFPLVSPVGLEILTKTYLG